MSVPRNRRWIIIPLDVVIAVQCVFDYQAHVNPLLNALGALILLVSINAAFFTNQRVALILGNVALIWQFFFRDWLTKKESFLYCLLGACIMLAVLNYNWFKPKADATRA